MAILRENNRNGFSLMELLVVIVIIGVLATIGTPALLGMRTKSSARADARDVYSSLRRAQTEAVKRNWDVCVEIDNPVGEYKIYLDDGSSTKISSKQLRPGNSFDSNDFAGADPCFNARGFPSVNQKRSVEITNSALTLEVTLSPAGHVSVPSDSVVVN